MQFLYCCELLWAIAAIAAAETSANRVATAMPPAQESVFLVGLSIENFQLKPTSPESFRSTSPDQVNVPKARDIVDTVRRVEAVSAQVVTPL